MTVQQAPEAEASAKVAQYLAVAVQVAEAVLRLRAQRAGARAADGGQAAGAARAERTAQPSGTAPLPWSTGWPWPSRWVASSSPRPWPAESCAGPRTG